MDPVRLSPREELPPAGFCHVPGLYWHGASSVSVAQRLRRREIPAQTAMTMPPAMIQKVIVAVYANMVLAETAALP